MNRFSPNFRPPRGWLPLLLALWCGHSSSTAENSPAAPGPAPARGTAYEDFKLIHERNIFNANRRPFSARGPRSDSAPPAKVEAFSLVGAMMSENGVYAFFDGTESKYRTVVKPAGSIAGFQVTDIHLNQVKLVGASNTFDLYMGYQMRCEDEGEWRLVTGSTSGSGSGSERGPSAPPGDRERDRERDRSSERRPDSRGSRSGNVSNVSSSSSSSGSTSSANDEEVLKRLMQQREREGGNR